VAAPYYGDLPIDDALGVGGSGGSGGGILAALGGVNPATWIAAGSDILGKALSPASAPSNAIAKSGGYTSFDNSGFNVAFGNARASSSAGISPWLIGGALIAASVVGLVAVKRLTKK